ncbi:MAG: GHKL domain-containing protein [Bacteroidetes bacterium]|nr:GHKL domain-containing protein [Bacteroidota bacterium]
MQRTINNFIRSRFFLLACAVISFALAFFISGKEKADYSSTAERFEKILEQKETHAKKELNELGEKTKTWSYEKIFSEKPGYYENLFDKEGLEFLIFENDTLRFWTDNMVAVDNHLSHTNFNEKIVKLPNGWFHVEKISSGKKDLFALILLKHQYNYQNKYLVNEFQQDFNLSSDVEVQIDKEKITQNNPKNSLSGDVYEGENYLFTLVFPSSSTVNPFTFFFAIILNLLGLIFSLWFLQSEENSLAEKIGKGWSFLLLTATLIVLRYLSIEIHFPQIFYETKLFSPELYGDAEYFWLGSLGDLLLNSILIFYLSFYFFRDVELSFYKSKFLITFFLLLIVFFFSRIINYIFSSLIINSSISFTLSDFFSQNIFTYLSLLVLGFLFISYFLLLDKISGIISSFTSEKNKLNVIIFSSIIFFIVVSHLLGTVDLILVLWSPLLFLIILWMKRRNFSYPFSVIVILLFIISFFSAHMVLKFSEEKENENRKNFSQKLSAEQDPLAEHLFAEAEMRISSDTSLINILRHPYLKGKSEAVLPLSKAEEFKRKLVSKYFSGYWEKYEIRVSVFDTSCLPLVQTSLPSRDNLSFFEEEIASQGISTESKNLFYLSNSFAHLSYLAHLPLVQNKNSSSRIADLFIEFDSRNVSEETGFPELMLDRKLGITPDLLDYSYAKYKNGKLISYHGKFPYSLSAENSLPDSSGENFPRYNFFEKDNYSHLLYMPDENSLVVISKINSGRVAVATTFSYLFAFFSLLLLILFLLRILFFERNFHIHSFRSRIQYVLVSMVLFSLLFFGGGTTYYIKKQYERQMRQNVREKMESSLVEGMQELGDEKELSPTKSDFFSYILKRMSNIFLTDITLYNKEGNLIGSSQMKMFDEGLMSRKMCPESYYRLALKQNIDFIHDEKIGNLNYLSAYCAFRNAKGDLLGYLNIPYFARQSELEKEIASVLGAIINIYVLLFVISVMLALFISEYFTKPLKLIQEKLSKVKLGKTSEPIEWKSQDEIGSLVNEYNRMIEELQRSAELLAKSERESAWREMAKQVAHEIKNPLTPMKLSIQHLQRTWKNNDDDKDKKIERITETLIEQIETLSTIASEFSNFAKMPVSVSEKINLKNILENSIALFKDSTDTEFTFESSVSDAIIYADKEQMLRVFNNLLKNALQAIPENQQGKIDVLLSKKENSVLIKIKDNGTGIDGDKANKIFTPNFTTKTGGMGLGLAMTKSIIETFSGKIWFETSRAKGTTFFVSLPEYKDIY